MAGPNNTKGGNDERLRKDTDREDPSRGDGVGATPATTAAQREVSREISDPERRREMRRRWSESILPDLPPRTGWHRCWVSSTHTIDTPQKRRRLGYSFVQMDDIASSGWTADVEAVKDGSFKGAVQWREMLAMEIPEDEYQMIMHEFHWDQPHEQSRGILETFDQMNDDARAAGGRIELDDGIEAMRVRMMQPPKQRFET